MAKNLNKIIKCPNCGSEINIADLINEGAKDSIKQAIAEKDAELKSILEEKDKELKNLLEKAEKEKDKEFQTLLKEEQKKQKAKENALRKQIEEEQSEAIKSMQEDLEVATNKVKEFNKLKAEKAKLEREKTLQREEITAELEEKMQIKLTEEMQNIKQKAEEKYELKIVELEKKLQDQINKTEEMRQLQEQGSQQLQGEAQELALEDYLKTYYPHDTITPIGKGEKGADVLHIINTQYKSNCGSVYYESKRTKKFNDDWIIKLKKDMQAKGADIGVIVTAVYPDGMERMDIKDGIYICSFSEFKALSGILRTTVLQVSDAKGLEENRLEKKELLYNYLTSTEFKLQLETIVNSFTTLEQDLQKERKATEASWKRRERQIRNVLDATCQMYGSIQGIAGAEVQQIESLEIPLLEDNS